MKTNEERMRQRLRKDRPMTAISIRIPEDVIEDMKEVAPKVGVSGYQSPIRAYIGQGLRAARSNCSRRIVSEPVRAQKNAGRKEHETEFGLRIHRPRVLQIDESCR